MGVPNFGNNSGVSLLQVTLRTTLASSGFHLFFIIFSTFYVKNLLALASVHAICWNICNYFCNYLVTTFSNYWLQFIETLSVCEVLMWRWQIAGSCCRKNLLEPVQVLQHSHQTAPTHQFISFFFHSNDGEALEGLVVIWAFMECRYSTFIVRFQSW